MEREIKFRVWDSISKMIHSWERIKRNSNFYDFIQLEHYTLMQYTGLKDKNGKEIYEGDIVKGEIFSKIDRSGVIEWSMDGLWTLNGNHLQDYHFGTLEIIGNIYENPELLKQP